MSSRQPYSTSVTSTGDIVLHENYPIVFVGSKLHEYRSYVRSGIGIAKSSVLKEKQFSGDEEMIIDLIHRERFDPHNRYVITGGHFHQLYVRNLGIFYNALLDPRIATSQKDWEQRQRIALQTLAVDLEVFHQAKKTYTTIVPLRGQQYTAMNVRTTPSDSLWGMLYTLRALTDETFIPSLYPMRASKYHSLQTIMSGNQLLTKYKQSLLVLLSEYKKLLDPRTGLIKQRVSLASSFDGVRRESSFYDNVILWGTMLLADELGIIQTSKKEFISWKQRILQAFWGDQEGIFLDDLSDFAKKEKLFSADFLIGISTRLLNPNDSKERSKLLSIVTYIKDKQLDKPFPLRFTLENHKHRMYRTIKLVPEYMGKGIWSHWGMEYIKLLIMLSSYEKTLLQDAKLYLDIYKTNIETYGGYPELYNNKGKIYSKRPIYRGVLHNGWVINYEQTRMLFSNLTDR